MTYTVITTSPQGNRTGISVGGIQEARDVAAQVVQDRMEAFGEDREALTQYGFYEAEAQALDMDGEGGVIILQDGWKIEVKPDDADNG